MIAQALAEWKLWKRLYLRKSIPLALALLSLASVFPNMRLFLLCGASGALFLVLGWQCGNRWKPGSSFRRIAEGREPAGIVAGRALAALAVFSLHFLVAAPLLLFSLAARSLPASLLGGWTLLWLAAFFLAMGLGFLASLAFGATDHLVGGYVMAAWLLPGLFLPPALALNPLVQAWKLAQGLGVTTAFGAAVLEVLLAFAAFECARRLIVRERKAADAH